MMSQQLAPPVPASPNPRAKRALGAERSSHTRQRTGGASLRAQSPAGRGEFVCEVAEGRPQTQTRRDRGQLRQKGAVLTEAPEGELCPDEEERRARELHKGGTEFPQTSKPSRTKVSTESNHRSRLLVSPKPVWRTHSLLPPTPPGPAHPSSAEPDNLSPGLWAPKPTGVLGSSRRGCWTRGSSAELRCGGWGVVQGEETDAYWRYQQVAPMGALGAVPETAHFACLGFILHPLVSLPPPSSSGHDSPLGRFAPYGYCQRFRPRSRTPRPAGDCARRLAPPVLWRVWLERSALRARFAREGWGGGAGR